MPILGRPGSLDKRTHPLEPSEKLNWCAGAESDRWLNFQFKYISRQAEATWVLTAEIIRSEPA